MIALEERLSAWREEFLVELRRIKEAQLQVIKAQGKSLQDLLTELQGLVEEGA